MSRRSYAHPVNPKPFKFDCPECGQRVSATTDLVGRIASCPSCGASITVQAPETQDAVTPPPPAMRHDHYLVLVGSEQRGPYALSQLQTMWRSGSIPADTLYRQKGFDEWVPISLISDLLDPQPAPAVASAPFPIQRTPIAAKPSPGFFVRAFRLIATAVAVLIVLAFALHFLLAASKPDPKDVTPEGATKGAIFLTTCHMVEKRLKSPTTAKFPSYYQTGAAEVVSLGGGQYSVRSYVDSQNSFGAMVRTNWTATVTVQMDGETVRLNDFRTQ